VFDFTDELVMEAGAAESAAAKDFIRNYIELEDLSLDIEADGVDFAKLGTYPVVLKMGQRQTASAVKIEDTTPPAAKPNQCRIFRGNEVEPEDFVSEIQDATRVICSFAAAPDVFSPGWQEAAVILTDESQNSAEIKSELYVFDFTEELVIEAGTAKSVAAKDFIRNYMETDELSLAESADVNFLILGSYPVTLQLGKYSAGVSVKIADTTPPVISGEVHKRVVTGGTISYRSNITVTDNYDQDVPLAVDSSGVNLNVPGTYTVIYSAADKSGNRAEVLGTVTVCEADMELVNEMADGILAQIIDQNMSRYEKAKAIFYWVHGKMKYTADINSREIAQGAYNCFYRGAGDCYTYMAASQVLLTRAGIDNMMVQRIGAPVPHYWNIVNVGGGWYHFDASPNGYVSIDKKFMFTESQAREFSRITPTDYENFKYDKSLVPEVVE
ncbi:MAG: hypothetical protein FWD23_19075, partial [Oscillospiraceae bacterium]|nr:hypothetical protein [Oscillospiraceae bacterium]